MLGAVVPPIFQNSLFVFEDWDEFQTSFDPARKTRHNYSRISNPTLEVVERKVAALERCDAAKVFGSGMAAISAAIFSCVESGAHVVCVDTCYGPTHQLLQDYLPKFGVTTTFVDGRSVDAIFDAARPETKLIYLESPSSIVFRMQDLEAVARVAREKGIATAIDNSYATPVFQTPAEFGVDIVVHTASKYLGGHSDIVAGALATSRDRMEKIMAWELPLLGAILAPFPAWLMLRGLRTLRIRLAAHQEAGNRLAAFLRGHPEVDELNHAGAEDHPQRELFLRQMRGSGGLISFVPRCQNLDQLKAFVRSLKVFRQGVSWGGFESLCVVLPFQPMDWPEPKYVVRLYCGLEDPADLIEDLRPALDALSA